MDKLIRLQTQGVRGGNLKEVNVGYIYLPHEENGFITVDSFDGHGFNYKQRENKQVLITSNGKTVFDGTFKELIKKLSQPC